MNIFRSGDGSFIRRLGFRWAIYCISLLGLLLNDRAIGQVVDEPDGNAFAAVLTVDGAIGLAIHDYLKRSLEDAVDQNANLVIVELDTPGGLVSATREIIHLVLNSSIPIVVYVSPQGARAASAGTYIIYASHVAAMAPATNLGAATPVRMGGGGSSPFSPGRQESPVSGDGDESATENGDGSASGKTAMERKITNDAAAYLRSLAELRGRNGEWAELSVRSGASLSAFEAVEKNVVDVVAKDVSELLGAIDGKVVVVNNDERSIDSEGLAIRTMDPGWRTKLLMVITNPNVAYILLMLGVYGIFFELSNPGAIVPGVTGAVLLLLGLFSLQLLPINYAGLALIGLGLILMVSEAFVPSFGALGIGGVVAFIIGSIILIDTDVPAFEIYKPLIIVTGTVTGVAAVLVAGMAFKAWKRPVVMGGESIGGARVRALEDFQDEGSVMMQGERWKARTSAAVRKGDTLVVKRRKNLSLEVEPANGSERKN